MRLPVVLLPFCLGIPFSFFNLNDGGKILVEKLFPTLEPPNALDNDELLKPFENDEVLNPLENEDKLNPLENDEALNPLENEDETLERP